MTRKLSYAGLFLALTFILPTFTQSIPGLNNFLSPMHIPVILCGFVCGWQYGLIVGFIAPLLRSVLFGMPPLYPMGVSMALELAVYGALTGALYSLLPKRIIFIYIDLIISLILGRVVYSIISYFLLGAPNGFIILATGVFTSALVTMLIHLIIIPPIVMILQRKDFSKKSEYTL